MTYSFSYTEEIESDVPYFKVFMWNRMIDFENIDRLRIFKKVEVTQDEKGHIIRKIYLQKDGIYFIEKITKIDSNEMILKYKIIFNNTSYMRHFDNLKVQIKIYYNDDNEDLLIKWLYNYDVPEDCKPKDAKKKLKYLSQTLTRFYFNLAIDDGDVEMEVVD